MSTTLALTLASAALSLGSLGGCRAEEDEDLGAQALGTAAEDDSCVEHNGLRHCPLGTAEVAMNDAQQLEVSGMRSAGADGVSIRLPEVTSFVPSGVHESNGDSKMLASAFSDGAVASTLTDVTSGRGVKLSATFTGNGDASTYSAIFTRAGEEVARLSRIPTGEQVNLPVNVPCLPPRCRRYVSSFKNHRQAVQGALAGSCAWTVRFDEKEAATIQLPDGRVVKVDQVELVEELAAKGSYSYLSFDRIDYTYDGGKLVLGEEEAH